MVDENVVIKSKYNSGIAKMIRMDNLWKDVNRHKRDGLYSKWNDDLDSVWCELTADAKKKKVLQNRQKELTKINNQLSELGSFNDGIGLSFKKPTPEQNEKRDKQYHKLMEKEIFLRILEEEVGKGTAWEDDDEDSF
jgi:hypothetical protein